MSLSRIMLRILVGVILLWLILPILIIIPMSFSGARFLAFPPPSWSMRWYEAYLTSATWMQATKVSLIVSAASAIIATILGTAAAYAINLGRSTFVRNLQIILLLPLVVPIVITAVGVFLVYANVGLLATMTGLILANVMLGLPYVLVSVLVGLRKFDIAQEMVSRSLGMNRFRTFLIVTLPQIRASVITGLLFAFISALDETVVSLFVSGGQYQTLTKRMFTALRDEIDPTIAAISTLLTTGSFLLLMIAALATGGAARSKRPRS